MKRARILSSSSIALMVTLVAALTVLLAPKEALAHPLGFESDLSEDGVISVCNPEGVQSGRLAVGIEQWNALVSSAMVGGGPAFSDVTGTGSFCEVRLEEAGGDQARFYARLVFGAHPDRLQVSARFGELPLAQKQATLTHELGHAAGLAHPTADVESCSTSVMTTYQGLPGGGGDAAREPRRPRQGRPARLLGRGAHLPDPGQVLDQRGRRRRRRVRPSRTAGSGRRGDHLSREGSPSAAAGGAPGRGRLDPPTRSEVTT